MKASDDGQSNFLRATVRAEPMLKLDLSTRQNHQSITDQNRLRMIPEQLNKPERPSQAMSPNLSNDGPMTVQ